MSINSKTKAAVDTLLTDAATTEAQFKTGLQDVTTEVDLAQQKLTGGTPTTGIDIDSGAIDGTPVGATSASTGNFSTLSLNGTAVTSTATELNILDGVTASTTEINYLVGTTSGVLESNDIGTTVQGYDAGLAYLDGLNFTNEATFKQGVNLEIGVDVQAYDVDTLKADTADTLTAPFRGTITTDNDLSFDMNVTNNFFCTPTATGALTFTNITAGQSGHILLTNGSNYAITAAATTKISSTDLTTISTTGTYVLTYFSNGTNVYVVTSGDLT